MTRMGKQEQRRNMTPKKRRPNLSKKTGPKQDKLENGYKENINALNDNSNFGFIAKIK